MGNSDVLRNLKAQDFVTEQFGVPTVSDILKELQNLVVTRVRSLKPPPLPMALKP